MQISNFSGVTFQQIEIFLAAAKYENFTKAADELFLTQASVSRNIHSLEQSLGIILFLRHKRQVTLTSAGACLQKEFKQILLRTEKAIRSADALQQDQFHNLTVGDYSCSPMDFYLLPITSTFEQKHPALELCVDRTTPDLILSRVQAGKYDVGFLPGVCIPDVLKDGIQGEVLFSIPPCVVLSHNHSLFSKKEVSLEDLQNQPIVAMQGGVYSQYWKYAHQVGKNLGLSFHNTKFVDNEYTMAMELKRGKYIAIMDRCFAPLSPSELRYIPFPDCPTQSGVAIVWSSENDHPYLQSFRSICRSFSDQIHTSCV